MSTAWNGVAWHRMARQQRIGEHGIAERRVRIGKERVAKRQ